MALSLGSALYGQNTSSVFSPDVTRGATAMEYRIGYDPADSGLSQRLHLQHGFTDSWRMRLIVSGSGNDLNPMEFRHVRWEGMWQFLEDEEAGWDSALRFEVQVADADDEPGRVRLAWSGKVDLDANWQLRGNFLTGHQFGDGAADGLLLEGRAQLTRVVGKGLRLGAEWYGDMNTTADIGGWDEQEHQLGPILKFKLDDAWSGNFSTLLGLSDGAADREFRFQFARKF